MSKSNLYTETNHQVHPVSLWPYLSVCCCCPTLEKEEETKFQEGFSLGAPKELEI